MRIESKLTGLLAGFLVGVSSLEAAIFFEFDYSKSPEFSEGAIGAERREALEDAAFLLGSQFVNEATLQMEVTSENDASSDTLATAASAFIDPADDVFGFVPSVVERKVLEGIDDNGAEPDGSLTANFSHPWDLDDDVAEDQFDFKATFIHELLHALGFSSGIAETGTDLFGFETPPGEPSVWNVFDQFVTDQEGNNVIDSDFALDGDLWGEISTGGASPDGGLFFSGPNTLAATGDQPVGLFSPGPWSPGSSGSHLDDDNPDLEGLLMLSATVEGPYRRSLSDIERAMLMDFGYELQPIQIEPEPEPEPEPELPIEGLEFELFIDFDEEGIYVTVFGDEGDYIIESSVDFDSWEPVGSVTIAEGEEEATFEDEFLDLQFYRATSVE